jgi:hypothetical protein
MGWKANLELVRKFLALEGFEAAEAWLKDAPELNADAYGFSKQCLIVYTMTMAGELASRDVRINCISPSPTATAFMDQLTQQVPADAIKLFCPSNGRFAEPAEMGEALVLLNSRLAGFVSGLNVPVDLRLLRRSGDGPARQPDGDLIPEERSRWAPGSPAPDAAQGITPPSMFMMAPVV